MAGVTALRTLNNQLLVCWHGKSNSLLPQHSQNSLEGGRSCSFSSPFCSRQRRKELSRTKEVLNCAHRLVGALLHLPSSGTFQRAADEVEKNSADILAINQWANCLAEVRRQHSSTSCSLGSISASRSSSSRCRHPPCQCLLWGAPPDSSSGTVQRSLRWAS